MSPHAVVSVLGSLSEKAISFPDPLLLIHGWIADAMIDKADGNALTPSGTTGAQGHGMVCPWCEEGIQPERNSWLDSRCRPLRPPIEKNREITMSVYKRPQLPIFGQDRARAIPLNARPELPIFGNVGTRAMSMYLRPQLPRFGQDRGRTIRAESPILLSSAAPAQAQKKRRKLLPGEANGFTEEMRFVAMRLHTKPKEPQPDPQQPQGAWEASLKGYLSFLVDSKLVHDTLDAILFMSPHPSYAEFRNTGLERSEKLSKDLEWFVQQGSVIPEPSSSGRRYSQYLEELAGKDPPSFICHFYNIHFAHITGGQNIGRQVAKKILDGRELEFYKWDGDLPKMLKNVKEKLNRVAEGWSRQEKDHCLKEAAKSFKYSEKIVWLILK